MDTSSLKEFFNKIIKKQKFKVFLLEDNMMFLKHLQASLASSFGDNVSLASFSESNTMIEAFSETPNVLVMDYNLDNRSVIDGVELIKKIKVDYPNTQIIVLTNESNLKKAAACYDAGAANFIRKDLNSIKRLVKELMYKKDLFLAA